MKYQMKNLVLIFGSIITLSSGAFAKPSAKKTKEVQPVVSLPVQGVVKWTGYGVGKSHAGTIQVKSGSIKFEKDVITSGEFTLDMGSLYSPDSEKLTGHLKSPDFFDVAKYPEAKFVTTSVEKIEKAKSGEANYKLVGQLTMKEKTEKIEFLAKVEVKDAIYSAVAQTEIKDRTQYGINYNSKKFSAVSKLGDKLIEDNIKLDIEVQTK